MHHAEQTIEDTATRRVRLLKIDAAAELLSVSRVSVYRLAARVRDPLPMIRIGGSARVPLAALEAWVGRQGGRA